MQKNQATEAFAALRTLTKERKFKESVDLTINFKGLDMKKPEAGFSAEVTLPHSVGKTVATKSLVFVGDKNFAAELKDLVTTIVMESDLAKMDKKVMEKMAMEHDILLAEGPVTLSVAKYFGQLLAPKGKMPKPIPTDAKAVESLLKRSAGALHVTNRKGKNLPVIHIKIGTQDFTDEQLIDNALAIYNAVEEKLPNKKQNVKSVFIKKTMSPPIKVGSVKESLARIELKKKPGKAKPQEAKQ